LELVQFRVNDWAGILLNNPMNLRELTNKERKKRRKKEGLEKNEDRREGRNN